MHTQQTLSKYLLEKKLLCLLFLFSTLFLAVAAPLKSYIMQWIIDAPDKQAAILCLFQGIAIILLSHMLEYASRMSFTKMACKSCEQIRKDIMDRQTKKSMEHYLSQNSGELLSCLTNDLRLIYDEYYMSIFHMFMWGSMMFAALVMIAAISPFLLVISMLLGIAPLIIPRLLARKMGVFRKQYSKTMGEYTAKTGELLKGFETLMFTGSLSYFSDIHARKAHQLQQEEFHTQGMLNLSVVLSSLLSWIPNTMVLLFGVLMVYDGKLTMGYLITAQSLSNFVISPGRMVSDAYAKLKASKTVKEKLEGMLSETADQPQISAPEDADHILVKNLSFTYPGAALPALKNISLSLPKHQKIALIGGSGSGKSTIGKLLCGYFYTYEGSIEADGRDLKRIMMIPQSPYIFSDTIYENLCLGESFSKEEIETAIDKAGLSDFVQAQPQGLQTVLLENGKNLSGGQAQRIALARALLRHCQYLVADEATASLDVKTTHEVMEHLLETDCTMVIITHDIQGSYMQKFDCIYYIDQGEIKEQGTFQELMNHKAEFYTAYTLSANS